MVLTVLGASVLAGWGQTLPDWLGRNDAPKPPDMGIQDKGGFFKRGSGALKRISGEIRKLEAAHGFRVFLMVEPVLLGTNAPELAAQLQQSWLPDGDGLVVVFESDSRSLGFGRDIGGEPAAEDASRRVPTHETAAILRRASEATEPNLGSEAYLEALMTSLVKEFDRYFELRKTPPPAGRSLRLGLLAIGGLTLLGLFAIGVGALIRLPSMAGPKSFRFPVVDRPERLGAPGGGGDVTVRRFREK